MVEGSFVQAYETSAYFFVKCFREYKVHCRYVKKIMNHIVYLGFPKTIINQIQEESERFGYQWKTIIPDKCFEICGIERQGDFRNWKNSIVEKSELPKPSVPSEPPKVVSLNNGKNILVAYREAYDFAIYICRITGHFYKNFRFGLGDELRAQSIDLLEHMQMAVSKIATLDTNFCISKIIRMRIEIRLSFDLKQIAERQYIFANSKVENILRLLRLESCSSWIAGESRLEPSGIL